MSIDESAVSEPLDALRVGEGTDLVRELAQPVGLQQLIDAEATEEIGADPWNEPRSGSLIASRRRRNPHDRASRVTITVGSLGWKATDKNPTVPRPRQAPVQDLFARHRAAAETALAEATGGASVCRVGPDRVGPVKEAEGRLAAITDLQRALRDRDRTVASQVASDLAHAWRDEATRAQTRGEAWLAYRQGGADALDAVTVELRRTTWPDHAPCDDLDRDGAGQNGTNRGVRSA